MSKSFFIKLRIGQFKVQGKVNEWKVPFENICFSTSETTDKYDTGMR